MLAICLGMQLLCEASEEGDGGEGLGILRGTVRPFRPELHVPQMGWNLVTPTRDAALIRGAPVYFANSFRLESLPPGWEGGMADYGGRFVAAAERGPFLACQFHPELSGREGLDLIARWLAREMAPC